MLEKTHEGSRQKSEKKWKSGRERWERGHVSYFWLGLMRTDSVSPSVGCCYKYDYQQKKNDCSHRRGYVITALKCLIWNDGDHLLYIFWCQLEEARDTILNTVKDLGHSPFLHQHLCISVPWVELTFTNFSSLHYHTEWKPAYVYHWL